MTKITVVDGIVECPECGDQLQAIYDVTLIAYIQWDEEGERWRRGLTSHEQDHGLVDIFCPNCRFIVRGDAIHTVEVEVWKDKWARSEDFARWEGDDA